MTDITKNETQQEAVPEQKPNIIRRMYDWVLSWAESPHAN